MRKAAAALFAVAVALAGLVACQSSAGHPTGASVDQVAAPPDGGTARAAADPVPVPGAPVPVPVPGRGGSGGTTTVPVPGAPPKGGSGGGGGGGTPTPAPTAAPTPTPGSSPPAAVRLTFTASDTPVNAGGSPFHAIRSTINVTGITGTVTRLTVALRATVPDNFPVDSIRVSKQTSGGPVPVSASLYSDSFQPKLSGANLGTSCTPMGGATTFDDQLGGVNQLSSGTAPYAGVFASTLGTLTGLTSAVRIPADANGPWTFELLFENDVEPRRLECWALIIEYQP